MTKTRNLESKRSKSTLHSTPVSAKTVQILQLDFEQEKEAKNRAYNFILKRGLMQDFYWFEKDCIYQELIDNHI